MTRALVFIHLVGVAFWLGGQLFLLAVALPVLRDETPERRHALLRRVGRRYGAASAPTLLVVIASGLALMQGEHLDPDRVPALEHKLIAVAAMVAGTIAHPVLGARGNVRWSRAASSITLAATLTAVWYATGLT